MVNSKIIQKFADWCLENFPETDRNMVCAEECSELIQVLLKTYRSDYTDEQKAKLRDHIIEEMSQVMYTVEEVRQHYNITVEELEAAVIKKYHKYGVELPNE